MGDRPYQVEVDGATTKFILPRRDRTTRDLIVGSRNCGAAVGICLLALSLVEYGFITPRGSAWLLILGFPVWYLMRRGLRAFFPGHGRVYVNADNDEIRITHRMGQAGWDSFELTQFESIETVGEVGQVLLVGLDAEGVGTVIAQHYSPEILDCLAADLQPMLLEAKSRARQ